MTKFKKIKLLINDIGINGEGVGKNDGYTVFVDNALIGEEIETSLFQENKKFARGLLKKILKRSKNRISPKCIYFEKCGGCQLMHMSYEDQLKFKENKLKNALEYIGAIKDIKIENIEASPKIFNYRNKIQLPIRNVQNTLKIGLFEKFSNKIVDINGCHIHSKLGEEIFQKVKKIIKDVSIDGFCPRTKNGFLRHLLIKTAENTEEAQIILISNGKNHSELKNLSERIFNSDKKIRSVIQNVNTRDDNVILSNKFYLLEGSFYIIEKLLEKSFKISPSSFFQINTEQAKNIYKKALEIAEIGKDEIVLDVYSGVGMFSIFASSFAKEVYGVECVLDAVKNARENAEINNLKNVTFYHDLAEDFIQNFDKNFDIIFLNPPRSGCSKPLLEKLLLKKPKKIIYLSCDVATISRDLKILKDTYSIDFIKPFDMFPNTYHVETLVKLSLIEK